MLHYETSGTGNEHLVLLHGFMEDNTIWTEMEETLSDDFTLIKIDLPGHGKSQIYGEVHTLDFMAEKVQEVTQSLKLRDFHLLGHSMGGYTALAFAEKYETDLKSLTLFFSTFFADNEEKKATRKKSISLIQKNYESFVNTAIPNLFSENEKDILEGKIALAKKIALKTAPAGVAAAQLGMAERPDRTSVLENFEGKIVIISGKHDKAVDVAKTTESILDKTNIKSYLLDCGHNGHWEKPSICAEILNTELLHNLPKNYNF